MMRLSQYIYINREFRFDCKIMSGMYFIILVLCTNLVFCSINTAYIKKVMSQILPHCKKAVNGVFKWADQFALVPEMNSTLFCSLHVVYDAVFKVTMIFYSLVSLRIWCGKNNKKFSLFREKWASSMFRGGRNGH